MSLVDPFAFVMCSARSCSESSIPMHRSYRDSSALFWAIERYADFLVVGVVEGKYRARVVDVAAPIILSGSNCSRAETELCRQKGVVLKMCVGAPWKKGECKNIDSPKFPRWTSVW